MEKLVAFRKKFIVWLVVARPINTKNFK